MREAYIASVHNALANMTVREKEVCMVFLNRMYERVPNVLPATMVCIVSADLQANYAIDQCSMQAWGVAQLGWDLDMSMMMWRNFRLNFPADPFTPEAKLLLSEQQLVAQYGTTFGKMVANAIMHPDWHPIIAHLLGGDYAGTRRPLSYAPVRFSFSFPRGVFVEPISRLHIAPIYDARVAWMREGPGSADEPQLMLYPAAGRYFDRSTRLAVDPLPESVCIDPKFFDFNPEPKRDKNR